MGVGLGSVAVFRGPVQLWAGRACSWGIGLLLFRCLARLCMWRRTWVGGSRGLWGHGVHLCLGSWLWGLISWGPIGAFGLVMALSFPSFFYFRALWFGLRLSFDRSFPLRVLFCHNCIFVLHIFSKLMKNKKEILSGCHCFHYCSYPQKYCFIGLNFSFLCLIQLIQELLHQPIRSH